MTCADSHLMLDEGLLSARLVDSGLVSRLVRVPTIASTNEELVAAAHSPDFSAEWPHMSVLTAEEQTGGRGRLGRTWASPYAAALSTSIVLRPRLPRAHWHWLSLTAGLALVQALRGREVPAALKWPNDVHVEGRKIAGLLAVVPPADPEAVIVGCGINVLLSRQQLPTKTSTSLLLELGRRDDSAVPESAPGDGSEAALLRTGLLADWLENFAGLVRRIEAEGDMASVRGPIITATSTPGQHVRVELPDGSAVRGQALGIDDQGALEVEVTSRRRTVLEADAGGGAEDLWQQTPPRRESYTAGEVVHLRAAGA